MQKKSKTTRSATKKSSREVAKKPNYLGVASVTKENKIKFQAHETRKDGVVAHSTVTLPNTKENREMVAKATNDKKVYSRAEAVAYGKSKREQRQSKRATRKAAKKK